MRVVLQQVDLDTCLTGLLLGVALDDEIVVKRHGASAAELEHPEVLCIEAGGSGQTGLNNFDHHGTGSWPPACVQALRAAGSSASPDVEQLVAYVAEVDLGRSRTVAAARDQDADDRLGLSSVFSGMRLTVRDPREQFFVGIAILQTVLAESIDPHGPMPERDGWRTYVEARRRERAALAALLDGVERFSTASGRIAGFLVTDRVGALGALYASGCHIAIAYATEFQAPSGRNPIRKFTVGGRDGLRVDGLLGPMAKHEDGWGGPAHGTIIASPRGGTEVDPAEVKRLVREHL